MKKKLFCILLVFLIAIFGFYNPLNVTATGLEALPFIVSPGWDSTVAAYGALKGFQYGQDSSTPEIVGDYTKPYQYQSESIAPLKPSWDSYADNFFVNNWSDLYPVYSEADAKKAWDLEKKSFDEKIGLGNIDMSSYLYNVLNQWLPSLVGTDYIKSVENPVYAGWSGNTTNFYLKQNVGQNGVWTEPIQQCTVEIPSIENYHVVGVSNFNPSLANYGGPSEGGTITYKHNNDDLYIVMGCTLYTHGGWDFEGRTGYWYGWDGTCSWHEITSSSYVDQYGILGDSGIVANTSGSVASEATKQDVVLYDEKTEGQVILQLPVGNPNDNDDKDNKKISVLPNVPSISGNLNNLGNINNGQLPIKFPDPNPNTGLIPSIPVLGNGGITVNIPVTNNNYEVVNNYDEHQEIYNNNYSYPTINYNYVNYYVNEGAITYEQFLQALQKYFNVIVYNNETNNYYPTTINNTTNNYYTIEEVINEEIPPILPPARISITDRFPFCLPFDIYKIIKLLNAEPTHWEWDVPVPTFVSGGTSNEYYHGEIGHVDFSETMHISLAEWDPVAKVLRTCLSVLWLVFLCFLFWKLIH